MMLSSLSFGDFSLLNFFCNSTTDFISGGKWFVSLFIAYTAAYLLHARFIHALVKDTNIPKINRSRLTISIWLSAFSIAGLLLYSGHLRMCNKINKPTTVLGKLFQTKLNFCESQISRKPDLRCSLPLLTNYLAPLAFLCHQMSLSIYYPIDSLNFYSKVSLAIFLYYSYLLRCGELCAQVLFLFALYTASLEIARSFAALSSRKRGQPSSYPLLQILSAAFLIIYSILWHIINLYAFPIVMSFTPSAIKISSGSRLPTALLNLSLISFYALELFNCPIWSKLIFSKSRTGECLGLRNIRKIPSLVLLSYSSSLLPELQDIQQTLLKENMNSRSKLKRKRRHYDVVQKLKDSSIALSEESTEETQTPDKSVDLLNVVKCVLSLKRKMRERHEQRIAQFEANCELPLSNETPSSSKAPFPSPSSSATQICDQICEPEPETIESNVSDDVVDIFIPVPQILHGEPNISSNEDEDKSI